jgi:hypothetical protein
MKLMTRLWKQSRYGSAGSAYERDLSSPFHHLLTILLSRAIEQAADAVCFGFRQDIVEDTDSREARRKAAEQISSWLAVEQQICTSQRVVGKSAIARGPSGTMGLPISFRIGNRIQYFGDQPFGSYGILLQTIQSRPVSLGASKIDPRPMRYIEIGYGMSKTPATSDVSGKRRFVEVDLEFQADNTFWIYIQGVRETAPNVRVSQTIF